MSNGCGGSWRAWRVEGLVSRRASRSLLVTRDGASRRPGAMRMRRPYRPRGKSHCATTSSVGVGVILTHMADLKSSIPAVALHRDTSPRRRSPWLALALALTVPGSYGISMLLPYYANDLDRFPLDEMPWGVDYTVLWPYNTAYSFPVGVAGIYALAVAPFVAVGIVLWAAHWWSAVRRTATWPSMIATVLAVAVSVSTLAWLMTSPLASTLASWWMD